MYTCAQRARRTQIRGVDELAKSQPVCRLHL